MHVYGGFLVLSSLLIVHKTLCHTSYLMLESVFARGFAHKCTDGHERFFVPAVVAYLGDIKEINDVMGIAPNSHFSDFGTLAPTVRLNEPEYEPALRTEAHMNEMSLL